MKIERYILDIVFCHPQPGKVRTGKASNPDRLRRRPQTINLALAGKNLSFSDKRGFVIPEDVRSICFDVLVTALGDL